jgi:LmbE family N-acetylglucosaminyl deacetylase
MLDRLAGARESAPFFEQRLAEDRAALARAGRAPIGLEFLDVQYREEELDVVQLTERVDDVIDFASAIYAPAAIGGNNDHVVTRGLAFQVARTEIPIHLYADLPYATSFGWPHWVTTTSEDPHLRVDEYWNDYLASAPCGRKPLIPRVRVLSIADVKAKIATLQTYRTQFLLLNGGPLNRLLNPAVSRYEVFWSVRA